MHYWTENGRLWKPWTVAWTASLRYAVALALALPMWDGGHGRALTKRERDLS